MFSSGEVSSTPHIIDFPNWLSYGALACCILAIAFSLLYKKTLRKRGTLLQLAKAANAHPPRRQPGVLAPFVYNAATPWGWLEYRNGSFLGQELALKRAIISIGREMDNEIELDDDTISHYHAELAWENGQVYVTDNASLNGVLLNGQRIRSSLPVKNGDLLEIGAHHFLMKYAQTPLSPDDADDPLLKYLRRPTVNTNISSEYALEPLHENKPFVGPTRMLQHPSEQAPAFANHTLDITEQETSLIAKQRPQPGQASGLCVLRSGHLAGRSFLLDRAQITVGRGAESDIVIDDASIARRHVQFSRQTGGDYVQDLASYTGSQVNGEPLQAPRLLRMGDIITLGNVRLEYLLVPDAHTTSIAFAAVEPSPLNLPRALRLPSKLID